MAELTDREERTVDDAVRRSVRPVRDRHAARQARGVPGAARRRATGCCPTELNFRANIFGLKMLGVEYILSASAVGSLQEQYVPQRPASFPISSSIAPRARVSTFFGNGLVAHVGFAHPVCAPLSDIAYAGGAARPAPTRAQGRHLRVHGRPAVLDAGRVEALSLVGHGHHRDDQPAGSQARARGGDLLRDDRAGHRLRLLAPRPRLR